VVEDDQAVGTVLELVLRVAGHDVEIVGNSVAACGALDSRAHDLVLLDLQLPEGHGFDVLRHLREVRGRSTPVIVLSSARADENRPRSLELGANEYITKPFSSEEVISRVTRLLPI
jgi:DNA-binding response OmpR family regulator